MGREENWKMKMKRTLAMLLVLIMAISLFGCASGSSNGNSEAAPASTSESTEPAADSETPLVVGYSNFNAKFSPFFAETAYDQDVAGMTQISLLSSDRQGSIIIRVSRAKQLTTTAQIIHIMVLPTS